MSIAAWLLAAGLVTAPASPGQGRTFTVYAFLPWPQHIEGGAPVSAPPLDAYLAQLGIRPIRVVYDFLTDGKPDAAKIRAVADAAQRAPDVPVSFDTEFGDRFKPETVIPGVTEVLSLFRTQSPGVAVGVYATLPQNSYSGKADTRPFLALNSQYRTIAPLVDFLSPVLYNYDGHDLALWRKAAEYAMSEAKKYGKGKRLLPYLSPVVVTGKAEGVKAGTTVDALSEVEMTARLQALYDLGADGCILWGSSQARTADGKAPQFDRSSGWGKAVVEFVASHH